MSTHHDPARRVVGCSYWQQHKMNVRAATRFDPDYSTSADKLGWRLTA